MTSASCKLPRERGEALLYDAKQEQWLFLRAPVRLFEVHQVGRVLPALTEAEGLARENRWILAGFLAYDAAPGFDASLKVRRDPDFPLLWIGLYKTSTSFAGFPAPDPQSAGRHSQAEAWSASITQAEHAAVVLGIKRLIARGDTYQVNYTHRLRRVCEDVGQGLFPAMVRAQRTRYAAMLHTGRYIICSASPELFFTLEQGRLTTKPMKGTAPRGLTLDQDREMAAWLQNSAKNRAENVMIVDMMRNDLGRIARTGSVDVPVLFQVELYPTVWQMTSTVTADTDVGLAGAFKALFPPASITGAPKKRTMEIIAELETTPRRIYTGAIGFMTPEGRAQFNVAIRTVLADTLEKTMEYGVGGGIVWDSEPAEEFAECTHKARILSAPAPNFSLLETVLWTPDHGVTLWDRHLRRLAGSAEYFGIPCDLIQVRQQIDDATAGLPVAAHKIRVLVDQDGRISVQTALFAGACEGIVRLALAREPIDRRDAFLYHKTTQRYVYEKARAAFPDADDVLLWNEDGELTETTIANIALNIGGQWLTPTVSSGLLAGVFRAHLLDQGRLHEGIIKKEDIKKARKILVFNSLRGERDAVVM